MVSLIKYFNGEEMGKLIRTGIPQIIRDSGFVPSINTVTGDELLSALKRKAQEELDEILSAIDLNDIEHISEEIGDLESVLSSLKDFFGINDATHKQNSQLKTIHRGGMTETIDGVVRGIFWAGNKLKEK